MVFRAFWVTTFYFSTKKRTSKPILILFLHEKNKNMEMMNRMLLLLLLLVMGVLSSSHAFAPLSATRQVSLVRNPLTTTTRSSSSSSSISDSISSSRNSKRLYQSTASASLVVESPDDTKSSSIASATFNLIKACVGSGALALPSGLALITDVPQATIPACILLIAMAGLSAYTFYSLGKLCHEYNATTLGDLWQGVMGGSKSWIVDLTTLLMTLAFCLVFNICIGDFSSDLFGIHRIICILGITLSCHYPLARLPSLDALAPVSILGVGGIFVTCAAMVIQWTKRAMPVAFHVTGTAKNPLSALVLVSMAACSYTCHFAAPDFVKSLNGNLKDYKRMTILGFSSVAIVNMIILVAGFLTFGGNCAGIILNNYANGNRLASLCRGLMLISVVGTFPFVLVAAKTALYNLVATFQKTKTSTTTDDDDDSTISPRTNHLVTIAMLAGITVPSLLLRNAGLVVGFTGATMGSAVTYIYPSILAIQAAKKRSKKGESLLFNRLVLLFGVTAAVAGGTASILSACAPQLLR